MAGMEINHLHTSGVTDADMQTHISRISSYRDNLKEILKEDGYNSPESTLSLVTDNDLIPSLERVKESLSGNQLTDVVVVGMGGSARGSRAVYNLLSSETNIDLHTIDTLDAFGISDILSLLQKKKPDIGQIAICVISKSGRTVETIANANILLRKLGGIFSPEAVREQVVVVTQPGSELEKLAKKSDIKIASIPEQISGRFSIFSAAGLLPLMLAGISVQKLVEGAESLRTACLSGRPTSDPAAALASILYTHTQDGKRILNHYFFTPRAEGFGSWIRQLYAESTGKQKNRRGEPVFSGIYPVTSIAPRDLHADFQLQLGGPKNFFTIFVREKSSFGDLNEIITDEGLLVDSLSHLKNHTSSDLYNALGDATVESFRKNDRPFVDIRIENFDTRTIGQLLMLEQLIVMYLGHLLNINTFNQPEVETYKDIARAKMEKN
jgi:glucose-6-phosphate isomerase